MRRAKVAMFTLGVFAFLAATLFTGQVTGEILWQVGVAAMLIVVAGTKLWPDEKTH
jgi:hypothetical protein